LQSLLLSFFILLLNDLRGCMSFSLNWHECRKNLPAARQMFRELTFPAATAFSS